jgi:hypothetical protein
MQTPITVLNILNESKYQLVATWLMAVEASFAGQIAERWLPSFFAVLGIMTINSDG